MKYRDLFPYANRMLGMQKHKVEREHATNTTEQALIVIANLKSGQTLPLEGDYSQITVDFISDGAITFTPTPGDGSKVTLAADALRDSELVRAITATLDTVGPAYTHPICKVIEGDPAIFRLRTQEGYVIGDALCLMSGNVGYPDKVDATPEFEDANAAADDIKAPVTAEPSTPVQGDLFA